MRERIRPTIVVLAVATVLALIVTGAPVLACSIPLPLPTIQQKYTIASSVVVAKLLGVRRVPHPKAFNASGLIQEAQFEIVRVLKGPKRAGSLLTLRTGLSSCQIDFANPVEVLDDAPNPRSDTWILMLMESDLEEIQVESGSLPINYFSENELNFLLSRDARSNSSLERGRGG